MEKNKSAKQIVETEAERKEAEAEWFAYGVKTYIKEEKKRKAREEKIIEEARKKLEEKRRNAKFETLLKKNIEISEKPAKMVDDRTNYVSLDERIDALKKEGKMAEAIEILKDYKGNYIKKVEKEEENTVLSKNSRKH